MKRTEKKRQNIIDAAVEEFRSHGFEGARTMRIAQAASVSSRTLYNHFPTKESLFDEIVEIIVNETGAIQSTPFDPEKPLREQLVKGLEDYIAAITDERYLGLNRMVMTEYLRDQELARRVFARAEMSNNPVRTIVAEAVAAGQLKDVDPNYATELLTAGAKAFFFWPKFLIGADSLDGASTVIEESVDMFLSQYHTESRS
ncbi:TetR/AcrR family transcriptional regulator [Ruegeria arenilitoris]|uniref:TetR/AcrR family transcriptional regulator n=1 Tax=Ruegeria arenilitoris TaxID=1173585 RepID=UPI00147A9AF5|nr:TetR/AcrR family transcriptional regulator [Ruegeria arenilitoris]